MRAIPEGASVALCWSGFCNLFHQRKSANCYYRKWCLGQVQQVQIKLKSQHLQRNPYISPAP